MTTRSREELEKLSKEELITAHESANYLSIGQTKFHEEVKNSLHPYTIGCKGKKYKIEDLDIYKEKCKEIRPHSQNYASLSRGRPSKLQKTDLMFIPTTSRYRGRVLEEARTPQI